MRVFIGGLPRSFTQQQLRELIARGIHGRGPLGLLRRKMLPELDCKIMVMRDNGEGTLRYFALVSRLPYEIVQRIIKDLNGQRFNGSIMTVYEFRDRDWKNDRRLGQFHKKSVETRKRRSRERRGRWTITELEEPQQIRVDGHRPLANEYSEKQQ